MAAVKTRLSALRVDLGDELVEALAFAAADVVQRLPHRALESHAGASIAYGHVAIDQRGRRVSRPVNRSSVRIGTRNGALHRGMLTAMQSNCNLFEKN